MDRDTLFRKLRAKPENKVGHYESGRCNLLWIVGWSPFLPVVDWMQ